MTSLPLPPSLSTNSSFSRTLPGFQLGLDSTSLGEFKTCPRRYYYSVIRGLQGRDGNVHLTFGILLHRVRELYDHARAQGTGHEEALDGVLDWALRETWDGVKRRPWISGHSTKNRQTLIQTLVWYLDALGKDDSFETLILANGKPAVELSFRFDSGYRSSRGEVVLFCGHIDRIGSLNGTPYILDIKTSSSEPSAHWARQFSPGNQFSLYSLAGRVAFGVEVKDLIVDGVQPMVGFSRFQRHLIPRGEEVLAEWLGQAHWWIGQMEDCAESGEWPLNDKSCGMYGGCPFQTICARSPASRETWLQAEFAERVWDPLQVRGDI